ncbi:MAG: hypothetical protein R3E87_12130 [Burkholderiaceae bacterium]
MRPLYGLIAVALMCALFVPIAYKLRTEAALLVVIALGFVMMLVDQRSVGNQAGHTARAPNRPAQWPAHCFRRTFIDVNPWMMFE